MAKEAPLLDFPVNEPQPDKQTLEQPTQKEKPARTINYGFFMVNDDPENFIAEVRDGSKQVVFRIDKNAFGPNGYMKDEYDMEGLRQHLIAQKILEPDQYILNATLLGS